MRPARRPGSSTRSRAPPPIPAALPATGRLRGARGARADVRQAARGDRPGRGRCAQALWALAPAFQPHLAACVHPGFTEAEAGLRAHGVPVERVLLDPEAGFALDPAAVPPMPTWSSSAIPAAACGRLQPRDAIDALRRPGRIVVVDEAFLDQVPGEPGTFIRATVGRELTDDVVVVRSFTTALAIAGVRAGVAIAAPATAARCGRRCRLGPSAVRRSRRWWRSPAHPGELIARAERVQDERADLASRSPRSTVCGSGRRSPTTSSATTSAAPPRPRASARRGSRPALRHLSGPDRRSPAHHGPSAGAQRRARLRARIGLARSVEAAP